jgi:hypothetical protein
VSQISFLKAHYSKGQLARAAMSYIKALNYYANEENWAVKDCDGQDYIVWIGSDDPLEAAETVLGRRKNNSNQKGGKKHGAETSKQNDSNRNRSGEAEVDRSPESLGPSDPSDAGQ